MTDPRTESVAFASFPIMNAKPEIKQEVSEKKLKQTKKNLSNIQKNLDTLIDAMVQNPSIFSRTANYWGKLPLWQKIVAGVILGAPLLVVGILAQSIMLYVLTAITLLAYAGISILLDDHYTHTQYSTANIKTGVTNLAEGLDTIMNELELISKGLEEQVGLFTEENELFSGNVDALKAQNSALNQEIIRLQEIEKKLSLSQSELENTCIDLNKAIAEQSALLVKKQEALDKITIDYELNQKTLEEQTRKLTTLEEQLRTDVEHYEKLLSSLNKAVADMEGALAEDEATQKTFTHKIDTFVSDKKSKISAIFQSVMAEAHDLAVTKEQYRKLVAQYEGLIKEQERQVKRLSSFTDLLGVHGLYASPNSALSPTLDPNDPNFNPMHS